MAFLDDDTVSDDVSRTSTLPSIKEDEAASAGRRSERDDVLDEIDVSASLGAGKSVMLSMSDVPDISNEDAQKIVEMFSKELAESISGKEK